MSNTHGRSTYLRTSEVAKMLCVSNQTISRWANEGHIPFIATVGGHKRFSLASVLELKTRLTNPVADPRAVD